MIIARSHIGGRDLYYGVPDLEGAVVKEVKQEKTTDDYQTTLVLETTRGAEFKIMIVQERVD